jgi:AcrR family transcriptional regulator
MPKIVDHEQKRRDIMKSAIRMFNEKGFEKTRISDIADDAKISRTTIYQYFRDKESLFEGTVEYVIGRLHTKIRDITADTSIPFYDKVTAITSEVLKRHKYTSIFLTLVEKWMEENENTREQYKALEMYSEKLKEIFENLFEEAKKNDEIGEICHKTMSVILYSMIEGLLAYFVNNNEEDVETYIQTVSYLLNGLKTRCVA